MHLPDLLLRKQQHLTCDSPEISPLSVIISDYFLRYFLDDVRIGGKYEERNEQEQNLKLHNFHQNSSMKSMKGMFYL